MASRKKNISAEIVPATVVEATTALAPMSTADLLGAGIADFKLTKEDLIELLVDEAKTAIAAERASAAETHKRAEDYFHAVAQQVEDAKKEVLKAPFKQHIKQLEKLFPADKVVVVATQFGEEVRCAVQFYGPVTVTDRGCTRYGGFLGGEDGACWRPLFATVMLCAKTPLLTTPELVKLEADLVVARGSLRDAGDALHEVSLREYQVIHGVKKLRTDLIRKVLGSNQNGTTILSNVKGLSAQFLAALKKS